jgi:acyl carrier protein
VEASVSVDDVLTLISEALQVERDRVGPHTRAGDLEAWDSLGTMHILLALADCGLKLAPGETDRLQSVEGIVELLHRAGKMP